jgi:hypothetical protein
LSSLSYLRDNCHKQVVLISESRSDSNRCTPYRGNPMNMPHASTLDSRMVLNHTSPVVHIGNISLVPTRRKHAPTLGGSLGDRRQTGSTIILGHLIPPPSRQPWSRGERFRPSGDIAISAYWAHNTSMRSVHSILAHGGQPIGP